MLTVFAGSAGSWETHRLWDHDFCGLAEGTDVLAARLREDDAALTSLGAGAARLNFLDEQYRDSGVDPSTEEVGEQIGAGIDRTSSATVLMPLGLGHNDHRLAAAGCRHAAQTRPHLHWFAYQDLPYGYEPEIFGPHAVAEALGRMAPLAPRTIELGNGSGAPAKSTALDLYPSQMRGHGDRRLTAMKPERYWRLELP